MLIIASKRKLEIGSKYKGLARGPWYEPEPNQCYKVIATGTEEKWINCLVNYHGEDERGYLEMLAAIGGPWFYYEIQTD